MSEVQIVSDSQYKAIVKAKEQMAAIASQLFIDTGLKIESIGISYHPAPRIGLRLTRADANDVNRRERELISLLGGKRDNATEVES